MVFFFMSYFSIPLAWIMMLIGACWNDSKNQMATSVYGMPVILVFMLLPLFGSINSIMEFFVKLLPNQVVLKLLEQK